MPPSHVSSKNATNSKPFPDKLQQSKKWKEFQTVAQIFRQIRINVLFIDVILQIASYVRFLKDTMLRKRRIEYHELIALTEECSARVQNKLPSKLKDP